MLAQIPASRLAPMPSHARRGTIGPIFSLIIALLAPCAWADGPPPECDDPCSPGCPWEPCCQPIYKYNGPDCNSNGIRDECDIVFGTAEDCQSNGFPDECDIAAGTSVDCNTNNVPDDCEIAIGTSGDCNVNGMFDWCEIAAGTSDDCNTNNVPDDCDLVGGTSTDYNNNGIPDDCEDSDPCCINSNSVCCFSPDPYCGVDLEPIPSNGLGCVTEEGWWQFSVPLQLDVSFGFGPPEFPPRTLDPVAGSLPMVSKVGAHVGTPTPYLETPTHNGIVDLLLGRPLIQETDFALPFGSAVFRHVRTLGTDFHDHEFWYGIEWGGPADAHWWDWNGLSWMMSENPVFLIDAKYRDYWGVDMPQKRCYLIPDAHHAIPFLWDENIGENGAYVAPPWFDAITDYDGTHPDVFHVWLNRQSIKYTFRAHREDLPDRHHDPPPTGHGFPYYALLERIEDQYGNRAEYEYCGYWKYEIPGCCEEGDPEDFEWPCRTCNQKGQLKSIKLYPAGASADDPAWTILYYHQALGCLECAGWPHIGQGCRSEPGHSRKLRSIFVFEGAVPEADAYDCLTLAARVFCDDCGWPGGCESHTCSSCLRDSAASWDNMEYPGIPDDWVIQVEYTYRPYGKVEWDLIDRDVYDGEYPCTSNWASGALLRTVVRERSTGDPSEVPTERTTLYRYDYEVLTHSTAIKAIYYPPAVDMILEALNADRPGGTPEFDSNHLFEMEDDDEVEWEDPETGEPQSKELIELASHRFVYQRETQVESFEQSDAFEELATEYGQGLPPATWMCYGDAVVRQHFARTGDPRVDGDYTYIMMRNTLINPEEEYTQDLWDGHVPYYIWIDDFTTELPPADKAKYLTIVDRVRNPEDCAPKSGYDYKCNVATRRVVEMNAQSFILRERRIDFDSDTTVQQGYAEEKIYDEYGRLRQVRTGGWGTDKNTDPDNEGLIYFFDYGDFDGNGKPDELAMEGVMRGTEGEKWVLAQYDRDDPDHLDHVTQVVRFLTPVDTNGAPLEDAATHGLTDVQYDYNSNGGVEFEEHSTSLGVQTEGGSPLWGIRRMRYNDLGLTTYAGFGTATARFPTSKNDFIEFYYSYSEYDDRGQKLLEVVDTDDYERVGEFERVVADEDLLPPLELTTEYFYDAVGRPTRVDKPGGRSDYFVYDVAGTNGLREIWTYQDVRYPGGPGSNFVTDKPVTIIVYTPQGQVRSVLQVHLTSADTKPNGDEPYEVLSKSHVTYDEYGRPSGAQTLADSGDKESELTTKLSYDAFGLVGRTQTPDGVITRNVRGMRGRVVKIYRGTKDEHLYWGTASPEEEPNDDMVLIEKRFYGDDVTNAGQLIASRRYNEMSANQYFVEGGGYPPNDENSNGQLTVYEHDCRMRPVFEEERVGSPDEQDYCVGVILCGDALLRTVTWYDYQDQVRFVAQYDPDDIPDEDIDPRELDIGSDLLDAATILGTEPRPVTLAEMIYDKSGQVVEERFYDVNTNGVDYTTVHYSRDGRGLVVEQQTRDGALIKSVYDARGLLVAQQTFGDDAEVQRIENVYDVDGRRTQETVYERMADATGDELDSSNGVVRYRYSWYDESNRLAATADFGTNHSSKYYVNGSAPPDYGSLDPPVTYDSSGWITACECTECAAATLVTCYGYDEAGRQSQVVDPEGYRTWTEYDDVGRIVLVTENRDGAADERRHTAYKYDAQTGLLTHVGAVRHDHAGGVAEYDDVDWDAADGTIQVTKYTYNANVVESDGAGGFVTVSTNGAWIGSVFYPDPDDGSPADEPSVTFDYRFDGQVAERVDARGVTLSYGYDDQDRLASITADISLDPDPPGSLLNVDTNAVALAYEYTPDGLLTEATVRDGASTTLSTCSFDYGGFRLLQSASQTLGGSTPERTVTYTWDVDTDSHRYRLTSIGYPDSLGSIVRSYGTAGSIDDRLGRLTGLDLSGGPGVIDYRYMGTGRLVGEIYGNGFEMHYDDGAGGDVTGLDQFGRVGFKGFEQGAYQLRYKYGYDKRGNRTFARTPVADLGDSQSWQYEYDGLNRLVRASRGNLGPGGQAFTNTPETTRWFLDELGNWSAGTDDVSLQLFVDDDKDGVYDDGTETLLFTEHHDTNEVNEIEQRLTTDDVGSSGLERLAYDAAGNLVFDGYLYFVYDAWNRVVEVREPGTLEISTNGPTQGQLIGTPGSALARYEYDALGRRVRTIEEPEAPAPSTTRHVHGSGAAVLAEYDVATNGSETAARWFVHGESFPDPLVMVDLTDRGEEEAGQPEYFYYLKDALGSPGLLTDAAGQPVERYTYTPYGLTTIADTNGVERSASAYGNPYAWTGQRYEPSTGLYHFWARSYSPLLGRFAQRDPQGAIALVIVLLDPNGQPPSVSVLITGAKEEYFDGLNLYLYGASNPVNLLDPEGRAVKEWLAEQLLAKTGGDTSWLDDKDLVRNLSMGFGLAGTAAAGGAFIVAAAPAIVAAVQSAQLWLATAGSGGGAALLSRWPGPNAGPQIINGIRYTVHALWRMMPKGMSFDAGGNLASRGIPPSVVENAILWGQRLPNTASSVKIVSEDIVVIFNEATNTVVTVY